MIILIRKCEKCDKFLRYLDNEKNELTFLICPKCHTLFNDEKYITIEQRIQQGYLRYERTEESFAHYIRERYIENDDY